MSRFTTNNYRPAYTIMTFCEEFGVGRTTAYKLIAQNSIAAFKNGRRTIISGDSVRAYFESLPPVSIKTKTKA